jgi:isopentenyl phosphate kinase
MKGNGSARPLVFLKLGGSLLTDKTRPKAVRADVLRRLAEEIVAAQTERPAMRLLIGHGSGSFGHVTAGRYQTRNGVATPEQWAGYAETARVAAELNRRVVQALSEAGAPALPIQPSASAYCRDGELVSLQVRPIRTALNRGLIPVIYGDVALDAVRGGTIVSTEELFAYLAPRLRPERILLAGEVPGVMTADPAHDPDARLIALVTPDTLREIANLLGGSRGTDVTGGMAAKVSEMAALLQTAPTIDVINIISGLKPGLVRKALTDAAAEGGSRIVRATI